MRKLLAALAFLFAFAAPALANNPQSTCVVLGDSIMSMVGDGTYADGTAHQIEAQRDISIRNLSTSGAMWGLPAPDGSGANSFNGEWITEALNHVCPQLYCRCVIVAVGGNDFTTNSGVTRAQMEEAFDRVFDWAAARTNNTRVVVMDFVYRQQFENANVHPTLGLTWVQYRTQRARICGEHPNCDFIARPMLFNSYHPEFYRAGEVANGNPIHLNAAGHRARATYWEAAGDGLGLWGPLP